MQRRGGSGQPVKGQSANRPEARNAPTAQVSTADLQEELDRRTHKLEEALQQQAATSEVLSIIRRSPADAQPVFDAIVQSAARLCGAIFSVVYLCDDDRLRIAATQNFTPEATSQLQQRQELKRPDRSHLGGRAILDRAIVHVHDVLADPEYSHELALAGGWRAVLAVPLLRDGKPVGALTVAKAEPIPFSDRQIQLLNTFADQALIAIENVRLFETEQQRRREISEALEQQTATSEVLKVISGSPGELEPVFNAMLANATRICEATFGNLFLCEGPIFRSVAIHSKKRHAESWRRNPVIDLRDNPGISLDRVAKNKQVVHTPDLRIDESYVTRNDRVVTLVEVAGARTQLTVPMLKEGELIGAIAMYRQEVRPFTDKQIELVQNFAAQAVIAIENTRLLNELRELLQQQTATADVLKIISSSPGELQPVFEAMLENATRICEAKLGTLVLYEGGEFRHVAAHGAPPAYAEFRQREPIIHLSPEHPLSQIAEMKQVVHIFDLSAQPALARGRLTDLAGARTLLGVPMLKESQLVGVISIYRQEVRPFTDKQIELVKNFAAQAVIAIENTRLLNELRESLQQQTATADVLKVISSSPGTLDPVFGTMLAKASELCEASYGTLWLREGDGLRAAAMHGDLPPAWFEQWRSGAIYRPRQGVPLARVTEERQPIQVADMRTDPSYLQGDPLPVAGVEIAGIRTLLVVPMFKEDAFVGAIAIYRKEVLPFTEKQIELVKNFAAQAVIAIENTRLLNELRESLQQQTATADVLKVISRSTFDLQTVLQTLVESAARFCNADKANVIRERNGAFYSAESYGFSRELVEYLRDIPIEAERGTASGRALLEGRVVHIADVKSDPEYTLVEGQRLGDYRTILSVPMLREGVPIGVLILLRSEIRPFTDRQIELVTTFADQAAIAIENVRLFESVEARTRELTELLEQQTATSEVLKIISSSPGELEPVFNSILANATRVCEATFGNLFLREGPTLRAVAVHGKKTYANSWQRDPVIDLRDNPGVPLDRLANTKQVTHVPDLRMEQSYINKNVRMANLVDVAGARTYLAVPMLKEDNLIGAIGLYRDELRPFTDKQIELVQNFAAQAVIAIENARLLNELRSRTHELAASLDNLRSTQDRLVQTQKLASLGQLTAGIAHEIKNPLNFVNNFSGVSAELIDELQEAFKDVSLSEKRRSEIIETMDTLRGNLDKVMQHGKRADAIVKNMLLHSREGSGEHRLVDINTLVEESLNLAYHGARAEKQGFTITLERSLDPAAGAADVFPQDITRALLNLISNGFYAATKRKMEANGGDYEPTLTATTKNLGDRVEIRIRDNGTGIPPEVKEKIFNPFFTTKPAGEGTGLGLSISHDIIVKQHGGSIEVDTQPGEFTELRIILPRAAVLLAESGGRV